MSYILDALKKSEHQRRMGEVPHIHSQQEALPPDPARRNPWVPIALLALLANLGGGAWLWWQHQQGQRAASQSPPVVVQAPTVNSPQPRPERSPAAEQSQTQQQAPARPAAPAASHVPPTPTQVVISVPRSHPPTSASPELDDVMVFERADADRRRPQEVAPPVENMVTIEQLPQDLRFAMMALTMNVHVYDEQPAKRFVLIDMKRYAEGHALPQGPIIERITRNGVLMSYQGQHFEIDRN